MSARSPRRTEPPARQRLSADQRRTQIVQATTQLVAGKGYANTTLTDIAEGAGVAKGLVWHYFRDRDDLMRETLQHLVQQVREAVITNLEPTAPVPVVVREVLAGTATLPRTHATELEAIDQIAHNLRTPDGHQQISMRDYDAIYAEHEQLLARGQAEGSIREANIRVMAVTYQGVIDAMIGYLQAHPDVDPQQHSSAVADVLLSGISAKRSPSADR